MNKIFRIVWNRALGQLVVASELCRSKAKGGSANDGTVTGPGPVNLRRLAFGVALALAGAPLAQAHTISVGYTNDGNNAVTFWYGTYHAPTEATYHEGNFHLTGPNGYDQLVSFTELTGTKPADLEDGTNNFYAAGSTGTALSATSQVGTVLTWQGVSFSGLAAGTYVYTYVPIANPTAVWNPYAPVLTNTLVLSAADLNGFPLKDGGVYDENSPELNGADSIVFNDGTFRPTTDTTKSQPVTIRLGGGTVDTTNGDVTFTGGVDGTGGLTKAGDGTLTLIGPSSYTGGTIVSQGTLKGDTTSLQGDIANNGTVEFAQDQDGTYAGSISGSGDLVKNGSGTVALTGTNTYTGSTTIAAGGGLALGGNGSIASTSNVAADGTFDISQSNGDQSIGSLSGNGNVALGNNDLSLTQAAGTFDGVIAGAGGLAVNGGSETLTGTNTYTGTTGVGTGATLALSGDGSIASSAGVANNGTLDISASNSDQNVASLSGTGNVSLGGNGLNLTNAAGTFVGSIDGAGGLTVNAGSETLAGNNSYTGVTTIDGGATLALVGVAGIAASADVIANGTLDISGSAGNQNITSLSGNGGVALGGNGLNLTQASSTFDGVIAGAGGLSVSGGSEALTGVNTYTGLTTIASGATLALSGDGDIAASSGVLANGSFDISGANGNRDIASLGGTGTVALGDNNLTLTANAANTFGGVIAGNGGFGVDNGDQTLTGINTYAGVTAIGAGGTLRLSGDGSIAASSGVIADGTLGVAGSAGSDITTLSGNGTVLLDNTLNLTAAAGTFDGSMMGTGGLAVGAGSETLTGTNLYTGATTIDSGATLALAGNGSVGSSNGVIANGTFDISGSAGDQTITSLSGNGGVALGGNGLNLTHASGTFDGVIGGHGGLTVNGGSETLTGANSYIGSTTIDTGSTLALGGDGSVAASANVIANGTFDLSGSNADQNVSSLSGNGNVLLGGNDLNLTNASGTFVGSIAGAGGLTVNAGSETLAGNNGYTGVTTIDSGATLALAGNGSVGSSNGVIANGTFDISGSAGNQNITSLSGNGGVVLGGNGLNLTRATGTFAGTLAGNGGLVVSGGTEILTGSNTYAGGTTVTGGGTLQVGSDANLGDASGTLTLDGGTLHTTGSIDTTRTLSLGGTASVVTDAGTTVHSSGAVDGNGALVKNGSGTLELDGVASHQGGTTVNGGTLILGGSNSYTGGTVVNAGGTLQVSNDANLGDARGNVTLNGGTLALTQSLTSNRNIVLGNGTSIIDTYAGMVFQARGDITGSGNLVKQGGGIMVVSGSNTFAGGTLIDGGTIQIDSGSSLGTGAIVLHGGTLQSVATLGSGQTVLVSGDSGVNVDAGTTTLLSGQIVSTGASGCFIKSGKGTLNMTGPATLANGTCVQDGMLRANGTLDSFVTVDHPGTLRGVGLVHGPISVYGTLAPGNSPGTLSVEGTVTMYAGSTFQADIDGTGTGTGGGNYSRVLVAGQGHTFVAAGTLQPLLRGITGNASNAFTPSLGQTFRIITAEGGVSGRFDQLEQPSAGLAANTRLQAFYNVFGSHSIDLRVTPSSYAVFATGANGNARSAGTALDSVIAAQDTGSAAARQSELLYAVAGLSQSQIAPALKALSGELHVDQVAAVHSRDLALQGEIADHLASDRVTGSDASHDSRVWVNLSQGGRREVSDAQGSGLNTSGSALTLGADLLRSGNAWLGLGVSHAESHTIAANGSGGINGDSAFVYGEQALGRVLLDGTVASSADRWTTRRADPLGLAASLGSRTNGHDLTASLGLRMPFEREGSFVEPFARATWQRVNRDAFSETGDSAAALTAADYTQSGTRFLAGLNSGSKSQDPFATSVTYRFGAALGVDQGGLAAPQLNVALGGQPMEIRTPNAGRGFVQLNANGTVLLDRHVYLYGGLTSEFGQRRADYAVTAGLRVAL